MTTEPLIEVPQHPGWIKPITPDPRRLPMRPLLFTAPPLTELPPTVIHPFNFDKLNQGNTGTCTQHGLLHFCMAEPMPSPRNTLPPGFELYDWAVGQDGYRENDADRDPGRMFGTTSDDMMKSGRAHGLVNGWVYAQNMDELLRWLATEGGIMLGLDWSPEFNRPDDEGFITAPGGQYTAGHFFLGNGYDRSGRKHARQYGNAINSWGNGWGDHGEFRIELDFLEYLAFGRRGDVVAAVQVGPLPPVPPPPPDPVPVPVPVPPPPPPEPTAMFPWQDTVAARWDPNRQVWVWEFKVQPGTGGWRYPNWQGGPGQPQFPWQDTKPVRIEDGGVLVWEFIIGPSTGGWPS